MALGYPDESVEVNKFSPGRIKTEEFVTYVDKLAD